MLRLVYGNPLIRIGKEGMIDSYGETLEVLNPEGQVKIKGEIWHAKSLDGVIDKGEKVIVVEVDGLELLVRKVKERKNG